VEQGVNRVAAITLSETKRLSDLQSIKTQVPFLFAIAANIAFASVSALTDKQLRVSKIVNTIRNITGLLPLIFSPYHFDCESHAYFYSIGVSSQANSTACVYPLSAQCALFLSVHILFPVFWHQEPSKSTHYVQAV
jgi:hypothetical protein